MFVVGFKSKKNNKHVEIFCYVKVFATLKSYCGYATFVFSKNKNAQAALFFF
jgi:hypothetical protein